MIYGEKRSSSVKLNYETIQEKKAFQHKATLKYQVKQGTCIAVFKDGWMDEGREITLGLY